MEEVYFEDLSPWHHLIPHTKLVNNDVVPNCGFCNKSVVGRKFYKCSECNFHKHRSCTPKLHIKSVAQHNSLSSDAHGIGSRQYHHLIEDVENSGNEEVVVCAAGCEEPVFGRPVYKCSIPNCTFLLHKDRCADLPHVIQHPMHPEHTLFLEDNSYMRSSRGCCDACGKYCEESLFYRCSLCNFQVDIKCLNSRWRINADDCHQHAFVLSLIQFTCQACGEEREDIANLCSICPLMIHGKCTQYLPTIKTSTHEHPLTRTYSLRQVKKQQDKAFCMLCGKEVNIEYGAYYCQTCDPRIAHLHCAYEFIDDSFDSSKNNELMASYSDDYQTHVVHLVEGIKSVEDPREIKQYSLSDKKLERCEACMQFIIFDASSYIYSYAQWPESNFLLHNRCAELPPTITRIIFHEHPLTHISKDPSTNGLFWCHVCRRFRNGFAYRCDECNYNCDVQCCLIPDVLDHEGHPHPLNIARISDQACNACGENIKDAVKFICNACPKEFNLSFNLCISCATLPLVARYEHDAHLLQLAYTCEYDLEEYYCLICEEERHSDYWFYYCKECKFTAHCRCVIGKNPGIEYGRTYKDEKHEHPVTIVEMTKHLPPCEECGKSFDDDVAVECTRCKFIVHPPCGDPCGDPCFRCEVSCEYPCLEARDQKGKRRR